MKLKISCISALLLVTSNFAVSQTFEINDEVVTTCEGSFQDDNGGVGNNAGTEGAPYSGTGYTYTICPDNPGDVIQVDFLAFSLYTNLNPNNSDYLYIYDGDSPGANSMGSYTGNALTGIPVTGTVNNVTGCLTFVFVPSGVSSGDFPGWEGNISCTTPCASPTAANTILDPLPDEFNSVSVCLNAPITFSDAGSFAEPGFTLENYIWNFDDGTIVEGEAVVEHAFTEPGEYIVTLIVEDNNGCQNLNLVPLQVLVSTIPSFNTDFTPLICLGATGYIDGSPVQSETWTALPPQVVAGETYLADGAGFSYTSSLVFDFFEEDQVLESIDDLYDVFINMEHSYMGDLQIQLTCPDGSQVILVEYPNGGGGTFLGEAIDDGSNDPGVGYDYYWDPDATNGTWGENAGGVQILPAGSYESDYDLAELVGCPLNGEWTIEVIDNLAIDNGYIFEWGVNLNPALFPGVTTFTPEIGLGLDSTWIEGPFMVLSGDGNYADITPPALGDYDYQFFAANNFGCTFDTTITVSVVDVPQIDLVSSLSGVPGCESFVLDPTVTSEVNEGPFDLILTLSNSQGNGFNDSQVSIEVDGALAGTYTAFDTDDFEIEVTNGSVVTLDYLYSFWGEQPGNVITLTDQYGNVLFESDEGPDEGEIFSGVVFNGLDVSWSPATGLDVSDQLLTGGEFTEDITYELSVFPTQFPECLVTAEVDIIIEEVPDLGENTIAEFCSNGLEAFPMISVLDGTPEDIGSWSDADGNSIDGNFDPETMDDGLFYYEHDFGDCNLETELEIIVNTLELTAVNDTTICENGIAMLSVDLAGDSFNNVDIVWNGGVLTGNDVEVQPAINPTSYVAQAFYGDGCSTNTDEIVVSYYAPLQMAGLLDEVICLGDSVIISASNPTGGLEPYAFEWTSTNSNDVGETVTLFPIQTTEYTVEMTDACESNSTSQNVTIQLNPIIPAVFTGENRAGCTPITTNFMGTATDLALINNVVWEFGDGSTSNSVNAAAHTYQESGVYDVTLTITGVDGCVYQDRQENFIDAYQVPNAQFLAAEYNVVLPDNTFSFDNLSSYNDDNIWTFDTYGTSTEEHPDFQFPVEVPGQFEIQLMATNDEGCRDTVSQIVYIVDGFSLYAPTSFTPDGDGYNEVWKIEGVDIDESDFIMSIYNREGHVVFTTTDKDQVWDGSYLNGDHYVPNGVYTFQILTRAKTSGDKQEIVGHITILR